MLDGVRLLAVATTASLLVWSTISRMDTRGDLQLLVVAFAVVTATYPLASLLPRVRDDELVLAGMVRSARRGSTDSQDKD